MCILTNFVLLHTAISGSFVTACGASCQMKSFIVKLPTAGTLGMCGGSVGGLVVPFLVTYLLDNFGYVEANVIIAGVWLHGCISAVIMITPKCHPFLKLDVPPSELDSEKVPILAKDVASTSYHSQANGTVVSSAEYRSLEQKENNTNLSTFKSKCVKFRSDHDFLNSKTFLIYWLALTSSNIAYMSLFLFLPSFVNEMGLNNYYVSLLVAIISITEGVLHPIFGVLLSRRKNFVLIPLVLAVCTAVAFLSTLAASFLLDNLAAIIIYGVLFGSCGSLSIGLAGPTIYEYVPVRKLGAVSGLLSLPNILGGVLSPLLGKYIHSV